MHKIALILVSSLTVMALEVKGQTDSTATATDSSSVPILVPKATKDTSYWRNNVQAGLNFNQAAFSSNWKGGGVNNIAIGSFLNAKLKYLRGSWSWDSDVDFEYGQIKNQEQDFRKSTDKLYLDTKVGYKVNKVWNAFGSLSFLSQFSQGYRYQPDSTGTDIPILVSNFLAPGYLTSAFGLEYKPRKSLSVRIGAWSNRVTFVVEDSLFTNEPTNYGVVPGRDTKIELAASQLVLNYDHDFDKKNHLKVRYLMFAAYENFRWHRIDHRLETAFTSKVNKFINFNISGTMIYDVDQHKAVQLSQAISIGVLLKFDGMLDQKGVKKS